jgi:hypothetical protein
MGLGDGSWWERDLSCRPAALVDENEGETHAYYSLIIIISCLHARVRWRTRSEHKLEPFGARSISHAWVEIKKKAGGAKGIQD